MGGNTRSAHLESRAASCAEPPAHAEPLAHAEPPEGQGRVRRWQPTLQFFLGGVGSVGGWHSCRELSAPFLSGKEAVSSLRHSSRVQVKYFWPRRIFRALLSGS